MLPVDFMIYELEHGAKRAERPLFGRFSIVSFGQRLMLARELRNGGAAAVGRRFDVVEITRLVWPFGKHSFAAVLISRNLAVPMHVGRFLSSFLNRFCNLR